MRKTSDNLEKETWKVLHIVFGLVQEGKIHESAVRYILNDYLNEVILKRPRWNIINKKEYLMLHRYKNEFRKTS